VPDAPGADGRRLGLLDFERRPDGYRHWQIDFDGPVATLTLAVDPCGGLADDYELKLNSYDLGVDIELNDAIQRLRFEHPEVRAVMVTGALERVFCAGANIQMLAGSSHDHKVNFCKFTNETRLGIEDSSSTNRSCSAIATARRSRSSTPAPATPSKASSPSRHTSSWRTS
jgi:benzoyl-CoA-dihydrodiol lyase